MHTYEARITCRECKADDDITFSFAGSSITLDNAEAVVNDSSLVSKLCWWCFKQNWRIKSCTSVARQESGTAVRM